MPTGKQMCEHIVKADFLRKKDGSRPTADEIWRYSPTGELFMVFAWYEAACKILGSAPQDTAEGV